MSDGVTESYLAELEECRALVRALTNELQERNKDLAEWRPRVEALAEALAHLVHDIEQYEYDLYLGTANAALAR
jgi:chromosome segregation ATPase